MDTEQHEETRKKLEQIQADLFQVKVLQWITLVLVAVTFLGLGGLVYVVGWLIIVGAFIVGLIYACLWFFERLVRRRIGDRWSDEHLEDFVEDPKTEDVGGAQS